MTYTYCVEWGVKLYYTNVGLIVIVLSGIIHGLYKLCLILFGSLSDFSRQCTYSCSSVLGCRGVRVEHFSYPTRTRT